MIKYYKKTLTNNKLQELEDFKVGCLIEVVNPVSTELDFISDKYSLSRVLLEDGLDENELPRFEDLDGVKYIYANVPSVNDDSLGTLLIVISEKFIMFFSRSKITALDYLLSSNIQFATTQRGRLLILILSIINSHVELKIKSIVKTVRSKKNRTDKLQDKDFEVLLRYKDFLNELVSNYNYTSMMYRKLIKNIKFHENDKQEVEDLLIDSEESLNLCKNSLKTINNITDYYSILMSNKLNKTIKLLTVVTIVINIPAAIGALYGMNVGLPFSEHPYIFWYLISIIVVIIAIFITYIRKKNVI